MTAEIIFDPIENSPRGKPHFADNNEFDLSGVHMVHDEDLGMNSFELDYKDNEEFQKFVDKLPENGKVLDLGAGLGSYILFFLKNKGKVGELYSVDLDPRNLEFQKAINDYKHRDAEQVITKQLLINADAASLPLEDSSISLIVLSGMMDENSLNQLHKKDKINKEMERVLGKNGHLIVTSQQYQANPKVFEEQFSLYAGTMQFYKKI